MKTQLKELIEEHKYLSVLFIEDDEQLRQSTQHLLENFFSNVDIAIDGQDGLDKYKDFYSKNSKTYDIIITDITMPNMTGIEMSRNILAINSKQVIIVISAHSDSERLLELIDIGISNFLLKPIDVKKLTRTIVSLFNNFKDDKTIKEQYANIENINKELKEANIKEQKASKHKGEFLANMSHEIRTPLNAINGFISLLQENEKDEKKLKYMDIVKSSSDSLLMIVNDILDISKIESGQMEISCINFEPHKELNNVTELFKARALEKNINLITTYSDNMPKTLYSDLFRIKQILLNLLSNAIKFTSENLTITCSIYYENDYLSIDVKDEGIGIAKDKQKHIFESFTQAESSTTRSYGGTGLGLAISKKLAQLLNGTLTLKSELNKGSTFSLKVEAKIAKEVSIEKEDTNTQKSLLKNSHVLIVEDVEVNSMFVGIILKNAGLSYDIAKDGLIAVDKFKNSKYDLILMDENMPNLCGIDATKQIIEIEKNNNLMHTPIIALTANAIAGDKERFLEAGMDDYLTKPLTPPILLKLLKKFLS